MIHRPRGHARIRCLVWSQQSPLEFFQYGSGQPCARVSRVLTKATSYLIALSLPPKEVGNDNRAEVKNDGFGQSRSFGDVGSMSGLPESGHDGVIYDTRPSSPLVPTLQLLGGNSILGWDPVQPPDTLSRGYPS